VYLVVDGLPGPAARVSRVAAGCSSCSDGFVVVGVNHTYEDVPFLPLAPESPARAMFARTAIEPDRMLTLTTTLLVAFLTGTDMADVLTSDVITTRC
jgi:hypothetical protein